MSLIRAITGGIVENFRRGRMLRRQVDELRMQMAAATQQINRLYDGSAFSPGLGLDTPIMRLRVTVFDDGEWRAHSMVLAPPAGDNLYGHWEDDATDVASYIVEPEPWVGPLFVGCRCLGIHAYSVPPEEEGGMAVAVYRIVAAESMGMYGVITGAPEAGLYPWTQVGVNPGQAHGGTARPTDAVAYDPEISDRAVVPVGTLVRVFWAGDHFRFHGAEEALSEPCVGETE